MSMKEIYEDIRFIANDIQPHEVYYPLKWHGVRRISKPSVNLLKICISLSHIGLPITTPLIAEVYGVKNSNSISSKLARLGDKRVIKLLGYGVRGILVYQIGDEFSKLIKIDFSKYQEIREKYVK